MIGRRHQQLCPFVDQTELINRMRGDLRYLRTGVRVVIRNRGDALALDLLDRWISQTITELNRSKAPVDQLQQVALEWQHRRARFLDADNADVIVIDD